MKTFDDKLAVITGAGSGIGRALALELARARCRLALSDINPAAVEDTAAQCRQLGAKALAYPLNVADRAAFEAHAGAVLQDFGTPANLIFNNAGVALVSKVMDMAWNDFEWLMGINFWGVTYGTRVFLPQLIASGDGHVVNVSSVFGLVGVPKQSAYNASKFAVRGYTEALRMEMQLDRHPVQVSCVHPGGIKTNIVRAARASDADRPRHSGMAADFDKLAMTTPERAAQIILRGVRRNRARILVGPDAGLFEFFSRLLGICYQPLIRALTRKHY